MSAMDFLEQANVLYRKCHDNGHVLSTEDRASLSLSIRCFEGERAASGFLSLEKYFLHLASHPWKREFWLLKMYGGFFCTKVKAHLKSPEQILFLVGYVKPDGNGAGPGAADDTTLVLEKAPNADQALAVAFDCQVAAVMCRQIGEYYEKMKCVQLTLVDAMNVILSGTSNDAVAVSSPVPPLHVTPVVSTAACEMYAMSGGRIVPNDVRGVGANYLHQGMMVNNYGNQVVAPGYVRDGANVGLSLPRHTIPAAGGMGLGVVGAARAPPEIMGAQGKVLGSRHDYLAPIPNSAPYTDSTESHVTGALRTNVGVGGPASRQPSMASSATGSKFSSSGYGSAPASTFSASSSAYAASSGYGSASQTSTQHYNANTYANTYATGGRIVDQVDYGAVATNEAVGSRHSRPHPLPQQTPPAFPYIDEDQPELATPFPEGTHEEHLMESIRTVHNMNTTQGAGRSQYPAKMASASAVLGDRRETPVHGGTVDGVQVPVSYDDWNWFRNQQVEGPPPAYNAVVGTADILLSQQQR
nr:hypothetical protein BaRGS_004672 [Batillaria attramentaria]